ncbi:MAG TPA: hypothetical protein PLD27_05495 [bacterium]|nr:hypothetical protein [bacterium]HOL47980.1 hypothetical protein [bacterium]HPQ19208.1 hypothetical protein [bacterium]
MDKRKQLVYIVIAMAIGVVLILKLGAPLIQKANTFKESQENNTIVDDIDKR